MAFSLVKNVIAFGACSLSLLLMGQGGGAVAAPLGSSALVGHKAVYDIRMTGSKIGSQVIGVNGKMLYTARLVCDGWITDHQFLMSYEYSGTPRVNVETKVAGFESTNGNRFDFSSVRRANGDVVERVRGIAEIPFAKKETGIAHYTMPEDTTYDISSGTLFPIAHTRALIDAALAGKKIFYAQVFDGAEGKGADEINAWIGRSISHDMRGDAAVAKDMDKKLLNVTGWNVRMAVFPAGETQSNADYEMDMTLLVNGIIKDMAIDYHDFTVSQRLVALEKVNAEKCGEE